MIHLLLMKEDRDSVSRKETLGSIGLKWGA